MANMDAHSSVARIILERGKMSSMFSDKDK